MSLPYHLTEDRPVQMGLVVLQADETIEPDMRCLLPPDAELLVTRIASGSAVTAATLAQMEGRLSAAADLLPKGAHLSVVGYGCTSASAQFGAARVAELIRAGAATPQVTEPVSALIAGCHQLNVTRIGLISPYVEEVSAKLRETLLAAGINVTRFASFNEPVEANVVRIAAADITAAAIDLGRHDDVQAVFLSCTNLRTLDVIAQVEAALDKPVLSSNQVLAWHMLTLADLPVPATIPGRLRLSSE